MQMHVSSLFTTTTYDIKNASIISVSRYQQSPEIVFSYRADEVLQALEFVFGSSDVIQDVNSTRTVFSIYTATTISYNNNAVGSGSTPYELFRNILALPLYYVNIAKMSPVGDDPLATYTIPRDSGLDVKGYFASSVHRIVISKYSLYAFVALSLSAIIWCGAVLTYCWVYAPLTPNVSAFPEINFAAKLDDGMRVLLRGLGNANSRDVDKKLRGTTIRVGEIGRSEDERQTSAIILSTEKLDRLKSGRSYL